MRKLDDDPMGRDFAANIWTYELPDGRRIRLDRDAVRARGAAALIRSAGLEPFAPGEENARLPVSQAGRVIGSLPATFDPAIASSRSPMFSIRPTDFRREGDGWTACRSLGPGDFGALAEFVPDGDPSRYAMAELTPDEEAAFAQGPAAGMDAYLGRILGPKG